MSPVGINGVVDWTNVARHVGTLGLPGLHPGLKEVIQVLVPNVWYSPLIEVNLVLVDHLCLLGGTSHGYSLFLTVSNLAGRASIQRRLNAMKSLWEMKFRSCPQISAYTVSADIWHTCSSHVNSLAIDMMKRKGYIRSSGGVTQCSAYTKAKIIHLPFWQHFSKPNQVISCIHSDIISPFPNSLGGAAYIIPFLDAPSRQCYNFTIPHKSLGLACLQSHKLESKNIFENKIKFFQSDWGGRYTSYSFN